MKLSRTTCAAAASPALAQTAPDASTPDNTNVSLSPSGALPLPSPLLAQAATPAALPAPPAAPGATPAPAAAPAAPAAPAAAAAWVDGIKFNAQIEAGVTVNPFSQGDNLRVRDLPGSGYPLHARSL